MTEIASRTGFDLTLSDEQQLVQRTAREFATNSCREPRRSIGRRASRPRP
jgi:hypothetical protein